MPGLSLTALAQQGWGAWVSAHPADASRSYIEAIWTQVVHEDSLMVNRLSWLVASQSFLFTAYAIVLNASLPAQGVAFAARQAQVMRIVPALGLATCGLIYLGLLAGMRVTMMLRRELRRNRSGAAGLRPPLPGSGLTHALGMAAPVLLPPLFCAAWLALLAAGYAGAPPS